MRKGKRESATANEPLFVPVAEANSKLLKDGSIEEKRKEEKRGLYRPGAWFHRFGRLSSELIVPAALHPSFFVGRALTSSAAVRSGLKYEEPLGSSRDG